jgi:hypothetical protein
MYVCIKVYKKRWTTNGFKLVGNVRFPLSELFPHVNKGRVDSEYIINLPNHNLTLKGKLFLAIDLRELM